MPADVRLEPHAEKQFAKAPKAQRDELRRLAPDLADDPQLGQYVPVADVHNKQTLKKWEKRVGPVRNLYKLELQGAWRVLYTVGSRGPDRVVLILEMVDHKQYERLMGYA